MTAYGFNAAPDPVRVAKFALNDLGNGKRLIELVGGRVLDDGGVDTTHATLLFELGRGWIGFNGQFWDRKYGEELARKSAHKVAELVAQPDVFTALCDAHVETPKDIGKWQRACGSAGASTAMLRQAQSYLSVEIDAFDQDPLAINCINGTLKLRWDATAPAGQRFTYRREPHDAADRITRMADVVYDAEAAAPEFLKTLETSLPVKAEREAFHRMMGYSATGEIVEQAFFFNQGVGRDGKSTLLDACRETLGTYALAVSPLTFLEAGPQAGSGPQPDLIALAGDTRLAIVSEPSRGAKLKEGLIKSWTSGSPISARDLNTKPINFRPRTKLVWEMNSFVVTRGDDDGIWRRLKAMLFRHQVPVHLVDKRLPERLRDEKAGILNWLIEGIGLWLEQGLAWPESLDRVTEDYRRASSPFGDWLSERCVYGEAATGQKTLSKELYDSYKEWSEAQGNDKPMGVVAFGNALRDRQIAVVGKNGAGLKYRGPIRLKTPAELEREAEADAVAAPPEPTPFDATGQSFASPGGPESTGPSEPSWGNY